MDRWYHSLCSLSYWSLFSFSCRSGILIGHKWCWKFAQILIVTQISKNAFFAFLQTLLALISNFDIFVGLIFFLQFFLSLQYDILVSFLMIFNIYLNILKQINKENWKYFIEFCGKPVRFLETETFS